jgi:hypothetical protein
MTRPLLALVLALMLLAALPLRAGGTPSRLSYRSADGATSASQGIAGEREWFQQLNWVVVAGLGVGALFGIWMLLRETAVHPDTSGPRRRWELP